MAVNKFDQVVGDVLFNFFYKSRYSMFDELLLGVAMILIFIGHPFIGMISLIIGMIASTVFKVWVDGGRKYGIN